MPDRPVFVITPGSVETVTATLESEADPSGAEVEWLATAEPDDPDPDDPAWTPGSWPGAWAPRTGRIDARSPTIGGASIHATAAVDLDEAGGEGEYVLWVRWAAGASRPMKPVATVIYGY